MYIKLPENKNREREAERKRQKSRDIENRVRKVEETEKGISPLRKVRD